MKQSYQEVSKEVRKELIHLIEITPQPDPQKYFWDLKKKNPKKFERLTFDTNGFEPYSETLSEILMDCVVCGMIFHNWNSIVLSKGWKEPEIKCLKK
jgi:hypothetical protein